MEFLGRIYVTLKPTVNDPQGRTIQNALHSLGFSEVESLRAGNSAYSGTRNTVLGSNGEREILGSVVREGILGSESNANDQ